MRVELKTLKNSVEALQELQKIAIPVEKAYALRKLIKALDKELNIFAEAQNDLIKRHGEFEVVDGEKTENKYINASCEGYTAFVEELNKLLSQRVEIKEIKDAKLTLAELKGPENSTNVIKPFVLNALEWLIKGE